MHLSAHLAAPVRGAERRGHLRHGRVLRAQPAWLVVLPGQVGDAASRLRSCLFYTDGVTEARNSAGRFFSLATCESISRNDDPETLLDRLGKEIVQHTGHEPDDDVAHLPACRC